MQIIINDTNDLSDLDLRVLQALVGVESSVEAAPDAKPAPAAKEASPAAKTAKPAASKAKPAPALEKDEADSYTMKDAVAVATKFVRNGKAAEVKAALKQFGASRVSELDADDIGGFIAALDD